MPANQCTYLGGIVGTVHQPLDVAKPRGDALQHLPVGNKPALVPAVACMCVRTRACLCLLSLSSRARACTSTNAPRTPSTQQTFCRPAPPHSNPVSQSMGTTHGTYREEALQACCTPALVVEHTSHTMQQGHMPPKWEQQHTGHKGAIEAFCASALKSQHTVKEHVLDEADLHFI